MIAEEPPSLLTRLLRRVDGCDLHLHVDGGGRADSTEAPPRGRPHFDAGATIEGRVELRPTSAPYAHRGLLVELVGELTTPTGRVEFLRQQRRFAPDHLAGPAFVPFSFSGGRVFESYRGARASVVYALRATLSRVLRDLTTSAELWITLAGDDPEEREGKEDKALPAPLSPRAPGRGGFVREPAFTARSVVMEVGVENLLHIEFRYNKKSFHLGEQIWGRLKFKIANLDIQHGEIAVVRKEFIIGGEEQVETEVLRRYEIMDGAPIVGEVVPIRIYLRSIPGLTPSYQNVGNGFRVLYFLDLMFLTREGKRYFKQQQIYLYRQKAQDGTEAEPAE